MAIESTTKPHIESCRSCPSGDMAPKSTTLKHLMLINSAPANHGKTTALFKLKGKLEDGGAKLLSSKKINKGEDIICLFLYRNIYIGLLTYGDTTPQIKKSYDLINEWLHKVSNASVVDIFITAAHANIIFEAVLGELAQNGNYERHFITHDYLPDNKELWQVACQQYVGKIMMIINNYDTNI